MRWTAVGLWMAGCAAQSDPPNAQSFDVGRDNLTEGQSTEITLVVSDPQGVEDIAGVTIVDADTAQTVLQLNGPPTAAGEYTASLTWDDFAALGPFDFLGEQDRSLEATVTDLAGDTSGVITARITLTCDGEGGTGAGDKCFNITDVSAGVAQACNNICETAGFKCATAQAVNAFGEVGTISFQVDNNGSLESFVLSMAACDHLGNEQEFDLNGSPTRLSDTSEVDWVCNCRPL